jgi:hypothetical protein
MLPVLTYESRVMFPVEDRSMVANTARRRGELDAVGRFPRFEKLPSLCEGSIATQAYACQSFGTSMIRKT